MQEQIKRLLEVGRQIRKELDEAATPRTGNRLTATPVSDSFDSIISRFCQPK